MTAPAADKRVVPGIRAAAVVAVLGLVGVVLANALPGVVAWWASVAVVIVLPAFAAARASAGVDFLDRLACAYAGLALSCWGLWVAGIAVGLGQTTTLMAPLVMSVIVAAFGESQRGSRAGRMARGIGLAPARRGEWAAVLATSLVLVVLVAIPFLPYGHAARDGIHRMGMTDWYKHLMVTTALQADVSLPPANPFLTTDTRAPYYYGFHLVAASVARGANSGAGPFGILLALTFATAAAVPIVLFVFARGLFRDGTIAATAAVGGSLLSGFDVIVWIASAVRETAAHWPLAGGFAAIRAIVPSSHLNFWLHHNERQLNAPYLATIWAPHHVSAVLLALVAVHLADRDGRRGRAALMVTALVLAALPAVSAYVALGFSVGVLAVMLVDTLRLRQAPWRTRAFDVWGFVSIAAAVLAIPILFALRGSDGGKLTLAVSSAGGWINGAIWSTLVGDTTIARLLDTPVLYLVQFGAIGVLAVWGMASRLRHPGLTDVQRDALTMAAAIVVLVTFVRPPVGTPNNLFARPMVLAWAVLACFAAAAWAEPGRRRWRAAVVGVSLAGTALAVVGATAEGAFFWPTSSELVRAAEWINEHTTTEAIVATPSKEPGLGYWLWRRTITSDRRLALLFGATADQYDAAAARLDVAGQAGTPDEAWRQFAEMNADIVLVEGPPPAWARPPCFTAGYLGNAVEVFVRNPVCAPASRP